ncbi:MAG: type II toxin-antitoxin system RelE/ParE family toxin [Saprospiraceae bacterium]
MKKIRHIETFKNYFEDFFVQLPQKVKDKYIWTFQLIEEIEQVPENYFKHTVDGIYEIRVKFGSNIYRTFCFFEVEKLVILANSIHKKSQKLPKKEIERAIKIREEYNQENK